MSSEVTGSHRTFTACCATEIPPDRSKETTFADRSCLSWKPDCSQGTEYLICARIEDVDRTVFALAAQKKDVPAPQRMNAGTDPLVDNPTTTCRFRLISRDSFPKKEE